MLENIKQEFEKNKEMKENLKKFREEAQKLEESDALKKARKKFVSDYLIVFQVIFNKCLLIYFFVGKH